MKRTICAVIGVVILASLGGILWVVVGRGDDTTPAAAPKVWSVEDAKGGFDGHPVYWVGQNFRGLPLVQIVRTDYPGRAPGMPGNRAINEVAFIYGDCTIAPGEESCVVPLKISVWPACDLRPEQIEPSVKVGPPETVRGATVQKVISGARIWTGGVSIGIAATEEVNVGQVISALVRMDGGKPASPSENFGPPDKTGCP